MTTNRVVQSRRIPCLNSTRSINDSIHENELIFFTSWIVITYTTSYCCRLATRKLKKRWAHCFFLPDIFILSSSLFWGFLTFFSDKFYPSHMCCYLRACRKNTDRFMTTRRWPIGPDVNLPPCWVVIKEKSEGNQMEIHWLWPAPCRLPSSAEILLSCRRCRLCTRWKVARPQQMNPPSPIVERHRRWRMESSRSQIHPKVTLVAVGGVRTRVVRWLTKMSLPNVPAEKPVRKNFRPTVRHYGKINWPLRDAASARNGGHFQKKTWASENSCSHRH